MIQDHIESIGKQILLKGGEVLIMTQLLKCLAILLQNPQIFLHFHPIQNPKVDLGPTEKLASGPTEITIYTAIYAKP